MANTDVCSIVEVVEDVISNGALTAQDVEFLDKFIGPNVSIDVLVELLSIPQALDWKVVDKSLSDLIFRCIIAVYVPNSTMDSIIETEIIELFDPDEPLSPVERETVKKLGKIKHGRILQDFLDINMI